MIELRTISGTDLPYVKKVYDYYILNSTATFHLEPITIDELKTFLPIGNEKYPSFIIYYNDEACGYCYFNRFRPRAAYDRTAEVTVYLQHDFQGKGIGTTVIKILEEKAIKNGICVFIGGITAENSVSIKTFERLGYKKCAHYKQVGEKFGRILDVVFYQKFLK